MSVEEVACNVKHSAGNSGEVSNANEF